MSILLIALAHGEELTRLAGTGFRRRTSFHQLRRRRAVRLLLHVELLDGRCRCLCRPLHLLLPRGFREVDLCYFDDWYPAALRLRWLLGIKYLGLAGLVPSKRPLRLGRCAWVRRAATLWHFGLEILIDPHVLAVTVAAATSFSSRNGPIVILIHLGKNNNI